MNSRVSLVVLLPMALAAQVVQDVAPLKNWPAPLYWQASQAEVHASVRARNTTETRSPQVGASVNAATLPLGSHAMVFVAMTPCRVVDTRTGQGFSGSFGPPSLAGQASRTFPIVSSTTCSIPSLAQAYSFNVTVIPPGFLGFVTVYPTGATRPNASTLNDSTGLVLANAAIVAAGTSGSVDVYANNATDLIIDINGYYAPPTDQNGNTGLGENALLFSTIFGSGIQNTAVGGGAIEQGTGSGNTAVGNLAGYQSDGNENIMIGHNAGFQLIAGNYNIDIGSQGASTDNGIIRIGDPTHTNFFVAAGVWQKQTNPGPVPVLIDQFGLMGTVSSSRRYKEDIHDMADASSKLLRLRPVTFRYKKPYSDGSKPIDYGLIAEEVNEIYPDLVVKNKDGQIETVQYQKLTPMLLNEVQKLHNELQREHEQNQQLEARLATLEAMLSVKATATSSPQH